MALDESGVAHGDPVLNISNVEFFQTWNDPDAGSVAATGDSNSNCVRVTAQAKNVNFLLRPAFEALLGGTGAAFSTLNAQVVCQYASVDFAAVPLVICSGIDPSDPASVLNPANVGRMTVAKKGPGSVIPGAQGEFGLLCVDDSGGEDCGANAIGQALAETAGGFCNTAGGVTTAPGSKTNQVVWGINARFGEGKDAKPRNPPAPNVVDHPRDPVFIPGGPGDTPLMGRVPEVGGGNYDVDDYVWDPKAYWNTAHQMTVNGNLVYEQETDPPIGSPHFLDGSEDGDIDAYYIESGDEVDFEINIDESPSLNGEFIDAATARLPERPAAGAMSKADFACEGAVRQGDSPGPQELS
jgi:hypothetical protein